MDDPVLECLKFYQYKKGLEHYQEILEDHDEALEKILAQKQRIRELEDGQITLIGAFNAEGERAGKLEKALRWVSTTKWEWHECGSTWGYLGMEWETPEAQEVIGQVVEYATKILKQDKEKG